MMKSLSYPSVVLLSMLLLCGCTPSHQIEQQSSTTPPTAIDNENREAFEVFVFMSPTERERVEIQLETLMLTGLPGGSLFHFIESPQHRVVATVSVPYGPPKSRIKNRLFQKEYAAVSRYFKKQTEADGSNQLGLPVIAETIANLRRTDLKCRVILCGSPIYDDSAEPTFTMATGMVPSDGLIGHPHSPWALQPALPTGTQISWLTANNRWGGSAKQRKAVSRFNRLYLKVEGGHLIRSTPDPALAFSFAEPYLANNITRRDEKAKMIDPKVETKLGPTDIEREPVIVPVEKVRVSFSKPGSFKYKIEMAGGDPSALAGEAIVLWLVYDGSGSMAAGLADNNKTILKIAESLPQLVKSLDIGIAVHREGSTDLFPIAQIQDSEIDGGLSLRNLKTFLSGIKADGGDAKIQDMISNGMSQLSKQGVGKRQFMMLVADHAQFATQPDQLQAERSITQGQVTTWCNQPSTDRRVIAMYSGQSGEMEDFFRAIGTSNKNSFFSRQPDDLIDALISAALPSKR